MSIADKITSITTHLEADYEGLENIGADLTNIDKNIYNIRTCLDNIYTNLPKTTGEGSNLSLSTIKGRINVDDILGNTQQYSTIGYNLLPLDEIAETTTNGITYSVTNGILKLNGTATAPSTIYIKTNGITLASGTYSFCGIIQSGTETGVIGKYLRNSGGNVYDGGRIESLQTRTIESYENLSATIYISSGVVCNNFVIGLMFLSGTYSSSNLPSFEPYTNGASPNPTYPQDINVVTGQQEVVVQNRNLLDMSLLSTLSQDRYITSGTNHIKVAPNTTYTFSVKSSTGADGLITIYDKNGTQTQTISQSQASRTSATFTTGANDSYLIINRWYIDSTAISVASTEPMLNVGSTATSYIEHQEQTKTLHLGDIELSKIGTYQDRIFETSGKNLANVDETQIGKAWNNASNNARAILVLPIEHNAQYTISYGSLGSIEGVYYGYRTDETTAGSGVTQMSANPTTITTNDTNNYIVFQFNKTSISLADIKAINLMLNLGSSALPYEPYGSDKWYIEKNIGKHILESAKNWQYISVTQGSLFRSNNSISNAIIDNSYAPYCNYYKGIPLSQARSNNNIIINNSSTYTYIDIVDNRYTSVDTFKTWLASNNVELLYVLATPTYTEITNETLQNELNELEKIMSYNGTTNINISGNLPMLLDITALKGE